MAGTWLCTWKDYDGVNRCFTFKKTMGKVFLYDFTMKCVCVGQYIGRQTAHDVIYEASMKAFEEDCLLGEILKQDERVTSKIPAEVLEEVLEPMNYTGSCGKMVDQVVAKWGKV